MSTGMPQVPGSFPAPPRAAGPPASAAQDRVPVQLWQAAPDTTRRWREAPAARQQPGWHRRSGSRGSGIAPCTRQQSRAARGCLRPSHTSSQRHASLPAAQCECQHAIPHTVWWCQRRRRDSGCCEDATTPARNFVSAEVGATCLDGRLAVIMVASWVEHRRTMQHG